MTHTISRPHGLALAVIGTLTMSTAAHGQDDERGGFGLGLIGMSGDSPYGFTDTTAVPFIDFDSTYFRLSGASADLKLPWISNDTLSFALRANLFSGQGYKPSDDPSLAGMAERRGGFWAGGALDWKLGEVEMSLEALADVSGDSDGRKLTAGVSRMFVLGDRFTVTPRLGTAWMNDAGVDYYYGVTAAEATAGRAAYSGSSTVNVEAGLGLGYMLTENQMLLLDLSATRLGDGIADSPIVPDDTLTLVSLGYLFRF
jgi:MipA family protein